MCEVSQDGYCDAYRETERTARKPHKCDACGATIKPGKRYAFASGIFDGEPFSTRSCLPCERARKEFGKAHRVGISPDALEEHLQECIAEGDGDTKRWRILYARLRSRIKRAAGPDDLYEALAKQEGQR